VHRLCQQAGANFLPAVQPSQGRPTRIWRNEYLLVADGLPVNLYLPLMWQYALWALVGAMANICVVFVEAARRVKGWPWAMPKGPGGGVYAASVLANLIIAASAGAAVSTTGAIGNGMVAFGIGAAGPIVVKKISRYVESSLPDSDSDVPTAGGSRR
jgi:hypothetical protein